MHRSVYVYILKWLCLLDLEMGRSSDGHGNYVKLRRTGFAMLLKNRWLTNIRVVVPLQRKHLTSHPGRDHASKIHRKLEAVRS